MSIAVFLLFSISAISLMQGEDIQERSTDLQQKIEKLSRHEGYEIAAELKNRSEWMDLSCVVQGMQDYIAGNPRTECADPKIKSEFHRIMIQLFEQEAQTNLQKANSFLHTLENKPQMHALENGKVFYEVLSEGRGTCVVQKDSEPLLHYAIFKLNGEGVVDTRMGREPYKVPLAETIPGFAKGVLGMRVGEKRKIYVHPDLGYGRVGYVPPNSLLIIDVEVIELQEANLSR
jgi:peptidylprolyl isomerase